MNMKNQLKFYVTINQPLQCHEIMFFHKKSKHIHTRYHFIQELIKNNEISVEFCRYENQFANM
jgi:hypothetical protein